MRVRDFAMLKGDFSLKKIIISSTSCNLAGLTGLDHENTGRRGHEKIRPGRDDASDAADTSVKVTLLALKQEKKNYHIKAKNNVNYV